MELAAFGPQTKQKPKRGHSTHFSAWGHFLATGGIWSFWDRQDIYFESGNPSLGNKATQPHSFVYAHEQRSGHTRYTTT